MEILIALVPMLAWGSIGLVSGKLCSWAILWIFWLQAGVFQWQSVLLTFIVGGVCLRYGQSYLCNTAPVYPPLSITAS